MKTLITEDKLASILDLIRSIDDVPGAIAECGVYHGGALHAMATMFPHRGAFGFDTFSGLPAEAWTEGEPHPVGDFSDLTFDDVQKSFVGIDNAFLVRGIFPQSAAHLTEKRFAFVHIDFDYYASTKAAIEWFLPRMNPGGIMAFDDYDWAYCPGVKQAIDEAGIIVESSSPFQVIHKVPHNV